ncbi:hypothetical protein [Parageobacillus thermoglucosidasius]|uniref:hypothetical protein n=1 Tax=Parageobacillus thermoglucosidasius TaxID=1426 RepID=UPI000B5836E6|nr:hypothetical protein [Parageobacillus thermoglucosidasius]MBY6267995.1 hypothetical protein [Parageobacillus thermoglucosidasius]OUM84912.1 MAG: hypothetical protein BAA00_02315 [Parageobacillus thermoglucosidasius]
MEQLSIYDFEKLYGKEHVLIAEAFGLNEHPITSPLLYKKMIEVLLYHHASRYGQNAYLEALRTYNNDVYDRFKNKIHVLTFVVRETIGVMTAIAKGIPFSLEGFCIKDEYTPLFKDTESGKIFRYEQDLEKVLIEAISDFAWAYSSEGQTFEIKNQVKLKNGGIDILVSNKNRAIVFELKKGTARRKDLFQVLDYSNSPELKDKKVERVLVAKKFDDDVLTLAKDLSVSCISYDIGYNHSDPYFLLLVSRENRIKKNEIFNSYLDDGYKWGDVFDGYVVLSEFIHPKFDGSLKDFYLKKVDELNAEIRLINKLIQRSKQSLPV